MSVEKWDATCCGLTRQASWAPEGEKFWKACNAALTVLPRGARHRGEKGGRFLILPLLPPVWRTRQVKRAGNVLSPRKLSFLCYSTFSQNEFRFQDMDLRMWDPKRKLGFCAFIIVL